MTADNPAPRAPFADFAPPVAPRNALRQAITAATRRPEQECVAALLGDATLPEDIRPKIRATASRLVGALRGKKRGGVEGLVQEYSLASEEGLALMCLAEALLRIPDKATRDVLIRDKIADGDWLSHFGAGRPVFVNGASVGLSVAAGFAGHIDGEGVAATLKRLVARSGAPFVRRGVEAAMRVMGNQFVTGRTIEEALERARKYEEKGFRYSYDMLGEAATTAEDAERYYRDYETAIHAIGTAAAGRGIHDGAGISIKLSALHPRYSRAQAARVVAELLPKVKALCLLTKRYDIGINIDAEEADRLELSLDLLESLAADPDLAGWNGLGFVVQAYGRRCPFVLDFIIDLARRTGRRIMVRLVKGAYWDSEIKRAQLDGLEDFPVYTRKPHTDVSYIACARKLLAARDVIFPQFATHNAQTLATVYHLAGPDFETGSYEFQCLHGMGEPLYSEVVGSDKLGRPVRVYAPVGTHETLLAYLVRRLLENGANSSFVNRIGDEDVSIAELVADPADIVRAMSVAGAPHDRIAPPAEILGERRNSAGLDLADDDVLARLGDTLRESAARERISAPIIRGEETAGEAADLRNPGDHSDLVGRIVEAGEGDIARALEAASAAAAGWAGEPPQARAAALERAADLIQADFEPLLGLIIREAGKSAPNAIAELREAIDFLRYYADEARRTLAPGQRPLGPVACISPWNFPLAIFTGQIAAALAAGNPVLAKPAEETPLIAAEAVRILHRAGIPGDVLQLLPGDGRVGAALVAAPQISGVLFTGSTEVARLIQAELAKRLLPDGRPVPLIAETGGQNAMIVDSSALAEQVVLDVIASAFDSAGQRCSALRVLCLQDDVADRILTMLKGALKELAIGRTDRLSIDIGPVITADAAEKIEAHIAAMAARGRKVERVELAPETARGSFVAPAIIEIGALSELTAEVFGPVLHVLRYRRADLDRLIDSINATGYGLTFGLHTRIDETVAHVSTRIRAGNLYVNRNVIGAVVGVQPFGGRGLSGTGPKAGGPLYIGRLVAEAPAIDPLAQWIAPGAAIDPGLEALAQWLGASGRNALARATRATGAASRLGLRAVLPGPVGESNVYELHPRGRVLAVAKTEIGLIRQLAAALATGNSVAIDAGSGLKHLFETLPKALAARLSWTADWEKDGPFAAALVEAEGEALVAVAGRIAALPGPIVRLQAASSEELAEQADAIRLNDLLEEVSISTNTTAAGGNAALMAIG